MKLLIFCLALTLSACATTHPKKPDYQHAPVENINHDTQ
ncbi:conserved exported hypothetical protein [Vibrio parahaemolyticus]